MKHVYDPFQVKSTSEVVIHIKSPAAYMSSLEFIEVSGVSDAQEEAELPSRMR